MDNYPFDDHGESDQVGPFFRDLIEGMRSFLVEQVLPFYEYDEGFKYFNWMGAESSNDSDLVDYLLAVPAERYLPLLASVIDRWPDRLEEGDIPTLFLLSLITPLELKKFHPSARKSAESWLIEISATGLRGDLSISHKWSQHVFWPGPESKPIVMDSESRHRLDTYGSSEREYMWITEVAARASGLASSNYSGAEIAYRFYQAMAPVEQEVSTQEKEFDLDAVLNDTELNEEYHSSISRAELAKGIDAATGDLNWALNSLGPPPSPSGSQSGIDFPVSPTGVSR